MYYIIQNLRIRSYVCPADVYIALLESGDIKHYHQTMSGLDAYSYCISHFHDLLDLALVECNFNTLANIANACINIDNKLITNYDIVGDFIYEHTIFYVEHYQLSYLLAHFAERIHGLREQQLVKSRMPIAWQMTTAISRCHPVDDAVRKKYEEEAKRY